MTDGEEIKSKVYPPGGDDKPEKPMNGSSGPEKADIDGQEEKSFTGNESDATNLNKAVDSSDSTDPQTHIIDTSGSETAIVSSGTGNEIYQTVNRIERQYNYIDPTLRSSNRPEESRSSNKKDAPNALHFNGIKADTILKIDQVFVGSKDYQETIRALKRAAKDDRERVFLVWGANHTGKFANAIHLGIDLLTIEHHSDNKIEPYPMGSTDQLRLIDFVTHPNLGESTVYIIQDVNLASNPAFQSELDPSSLLDLRTELQKKGNFLILTAEISADEGANLSLCKIKAELNNDQLSKVFDEHLNYYINKKPGRTYKAAIEISRNIKTTLIPILTTPYSIDYYCGTTLKIIEETLTSSLLTEKETQKLEELSDDQLKKKLEKLLPIEAQRISRFGWEPTRPWFESLPLNAKLYAMLAVLLEGVWVYNLDEIYHMLVDKLIDDGVSTLRDWREMGRDDLLALIRGRISEDDRVVFESIYTHEIETQIHNWQPLLWGLNDILDAWIDSYRAPEDWIVRQAFGRAIGRLGVHHWPKMRLRLTELANKESAPIAVVSGYALEEVCELSIDNYRMVVDLLNEWARSRNYDKMWTTAADIWRIYNTLVPKVRSLDPIRASRAQETLTQLQKILTWLVTHNANFDNITRRRAKENAERDLREQDLSEEEFQRKLKEYSLLNFAGYSFDILESVFRAVIEISQNNAEDATNLVLSWLKAKKSTGERFAGKTAAARLFEAAGSSKNKLDKERHLPLLNLVGPILDAEDLEAFDIDNQDRETEAWKIAIQENEYLTINSTVYETIASWFDENRWPTETDTSYWPNMIQSEMLKVANRASPRQANLLRANIILHWLDSDFPTAHLVGRALISRSFAMNGEPGLLPGAGTGVVCIDSSRLGRLFETINLGQILYELMASRINTYAYWMGNAELAASPEKDTNIEKLKHPIELSRLIVPPYLSCNEHRSEPVRLLLALAQSSILDLADMSDEAQNMITIVAKPQPEENSPDLDLEKMLVDTKFVTLKQNPEALGENVNQIEETIRDQFNNLLLVAPAPEIWATIQPYLEHVIPEPEAVLARCDEWAMALDSLGEFKPGVDVARVLMICIVWAAKVDPLSCLDRVTYWLDSPVGQTIHLSGLAATRTLMNVFGQREEPIVEKVGRRIGLKVEAVAALKTLGSLEPIFTVPSFTKLLELAAKLVTKDNDLRTIQLVLNTIKNWLKSTNLAEIILNKEENLTSQQENEYHSSANHLLARVAESIKGENISIIYWMLDSWLQEEKAPPAVAECARWLMAQLAIRVHSGLPDPRKGFKYGIVLLDRSSTEQQSDDQQKNKSLIETCRCFLTELAARESPRLKYQTIVWELGQLTPLVIRPDNSLFLRIHSGNRKTPTLLAKPILDLISFEHTGFILLLTNRPAVDQNDWPQDWHGIPAIYYSTGNPRPDCPIGFTQVVEQKNLHDAATEIVRKLILS